MASTEVAANLTEAHRLAQAQLSAETVGQMSRIWPALDLARLDATTQRWLDLATQIIRTQRQASASLAAQYVRFYRALELGIPPTFTPDLAAVLDLEQLLTSLRVTGPVKVKEALTAGHTLTDAARIGFVASSGAASRHALNGGRDTIIDRRDRQLLGVARATSGNCCAFCAMLAARGPVYFSEESAGFRPHDICHCQPEPVYRTDTAWPAGSREFADLWASSTKGHSGTQAINAFRRAFDT